MSEYWEPPADMIEKAAKAACESHHKETAAWDRWDRNVWRQNARAALLAAFPNGPSASIEAVRELIREVKCTPLSPCEECEAGHA